ncbi:uncharacterized protein L969DRAFT_126228 [Mixia osmundae IAM 14324]|uniref:Uncharacterized protein n=1 Tax=Mixia osmundae (strain CBS 9802 / IAM 14324 / JCM 22182 / KY 12970) TaxID=764103 RepID=G7DV90_MIXOS|nr:uncharacterized protein L969DRAFT_126228 [Mixia osmundae IAM 14324]KEI42077.1 hypothetical protein L969DRAFT_126228 [Mixia osmundae IAM 14324]GAA94500.1 hypothetical protein E5Q_01152 [Mixia osmundae IAM 14324]
MSEQGRLAAGQSVLSSPSAAAHSQAVSAVSPPASPGVAAQSGVYAVDGSPSTGVACIIPPTPINANFAIDEASLEHRLELFDVHAASLTTTAAILPHLPQVGVQTCLPKPAIHRHCSLAKSNGSSSPTSSAGEVSFLSRQDIVLGSPCPSRPLSRRSSSGASAASSNISISTATTTKSVRFCSVAPPVHLTFSPVDYDRTPIEPSGEARELCLPPRTNKAERSQWKKCLARRKKEACAKIAAGETVPGCTLISPAAHALVGAVGGESGMLPSTRSPDESDLSHDEDVDDAMEDDVDDEMPDLRTDEDRPHVQARPVKSIMRKRQPRKSRSDSISEASSGEGSSGPSRAGLGLSASTSSDVAVSSPTSSSASSPPLIATALSDDLPPVPHLSHDEFSSGSEDSDEWHTFPALPSSYGLPAALTHEALQALNAPATLTPIIFKNQQQAIIEAHLESRGSASPVGVTPEMGEEEDDDDTIDNRSTAVKEPLPVPEDEGDDGCERDDEDEEDEDEDDEDEAEEDEEEDAQNEAEPEEAPKPKKFGMCALGKWSRCDLYSSCDALGGF